MDTLARVDFEILSATVNELAKVGIWAYNINVVGIVEEHYVGIFACFTQF